MSAFLCSDQTFTALAAYYVNKRGICSEVRREVADFGAAYDRETLDDPSTVIPKGFPTWQTFRDRAYDADCVAVVAAILKAGNMRSVVDRYSDRHGDTLYTRKDAPKVTAAWVKAAATFKPGAVFKLCACVNYQSCEPADWEKSTAYRVLQAIKDTAARKSEGYDEAPWGL